MNIFFIGMGYMGSERLKAMVNLKKKNKINILGFYDTKIKSIKVHKKIYKSVPILNKYFFKNNKIDLCVISVPHNLAYKYSKICLKN